MSQNVLNAGFVRINQAMGNLMGAVRSGNKEDIIRVANNLMEDCDELIEVVYTIAGVTEDDIVLANKNDERTLTKQAMWTPGDPISFQDESSPIPSETLTDEPEST